MIHKRSPSRAGLEEVLVFVQAHLAPEMTPADARRILTSLVRGPEAVIDLWDEQGRLAAAAVVDTCTSADDVAELALLGLRERELSAEALQVLFACAEELTRQGPRSALDLSLAPERRPWEPFLRARGYTPAFTEHVMERDARPPPLAPRTPLPTGYHWRDVEDGQLADYHRLVSTAFASIPGAFVPPLEEVAQTVKRATHRPRVLMDGSLLRAFATVSLRERADGGRTGRVGTLGREPALRGTGLGEHALLQAMELLRAAGADTLELTVTATNDAALRLYQRQGFQTVHSVPVFRRRLTERR